MSGAAIKRMTYADYERIPADGKRHEIIEGEWYSTPTPPTAHQRVSGSLLCILDAHARKTGRGECFCAPLDVLLSDFDIVQPDLLFISPERSAILTEKNIQGAPDLVVEIVSPSTAAIDRGRKLELYGRTGVREYWIVDPAAKLVEVHEFASPRRTRVYAEGQSFESVLLPGLTVRLDGIF